MKKGITFSTFDLFHAGHVLMLKEAKSQCDWLIVCLQTDPTVDRPNKNKPVQTLFERFIQVTACKYVDELLVYTTEDELIQILKATDYDVRIIGEEYADKSFTGNDYCQDKLYFNKRKHSFSTTELRDRIIDYNKSRLLTN
jgi:glycerol-3-phosphate cytidylyltransferase|tara:strand:+ start:267 stop:689 length:423 start_codon:yes stop_codon:yes gene_type:complete